VPKDSWAAFLWKQDHFIQSAQKNFVLKVTTVTRVCVCARVRVCVRGRAYEYRDDECK
jgi:hypothetical protein